METLHEAIELNNQGVRHLSNGSFVDGYVSLQRAITATRTFAAQAPAPAIEPPTPRGNLNARACFQDRSNRLSDLQRSSFYVYDRAIHLSCDYAPSDLHDLERIGNTTYSVIIFNLALVSHRNGKCTGREEFLTRASRFYDLVVRIVDGTGVESESLDVIKCLALNNCAEIFHEMCDYDASGERFEAMKNQLTSSDGYLETCIDAEEAEELRLNLEHWRPWLGLHKLKRIYRKQEISFSIFSAISHLVTCLFSAGAGLTVQEGWILDSTHRS